VRVMELDSRDERRQRFQFSSLLCDQSVEFRYPIFGRTEVCICDFIGTMFTDIQWRVDMVFCKHMHGAEDDEPNNTTYRHEISVTSRALQVKVRETLHSWHSSTLVQRNISAGLFISTGQMMQQDVPHMLASVVRLALHACKANMRSCTSAHLHCCLLKGDLILQSVVLKGQVYGPGGVKCIPE